MIGITPEQEQELAGRLGRLMGRFRRPTGADMSAPTERARELLLSQMRGGAEAAGRALPNRQSPIRNPQSPQAPGVDDLRDRFAGVLLSQIAQLPQQMLAGREAQRGRDFAGKMGREEGAAGHRRAVALGEMGGRQATELENLRQQGQETLLDKELAARTQQEQAENDPMVQGKRAAVAGAIEQGDSEQARRIAAGEIAPGHAPQMVEAAMPRLEAEAQKIIEAQQRRDPKGRYPLALTLHFDDLMKRVRQEHGERAAEAVGQQLNKWFEENKPSSFWRNWQDRRGEWAMAYHQHRRNMYGAGQEGATVEELFR